VGPRVGRHSGWDRGRAIGPAGAYPGVCALFLGQRLTVGVPRALARAAHGGGGDSGGPAAGGYRVVSRRRTTTSRHMDSRRPTTGPRDLPSSICHHRVLRFRVAPAGATPALDAWRMCAVVDEGRVMRPLVVRDSRALVVVARRGLARAWPVVDAAREGMERPEQTERDGRDAPVLDVIGRVLTGLDGVRRPDVTNAAVPVLRLPACDGPRDVDSGGYPSRPIAVEGLRARLDLSPKERAPPAYVVRHAEQVVGGTLGMERARDDDVGLCDTMIHATAHRSRTAIDTGHGTPRMHTVYNLALVAEAAR